MSTFWLSDAESRVLGPIGLDVIRDLALRGKLADVRAVSKDGRTFLPLAQVPEIQQALAAPRSVDDVARAQAEATRQIRDWLALVKTQSSADVFRVPPTASREAWRAAFFSLVYRYVPGRLPADATPELRLACEEAFLHLAERMVEVEKTFRSPRPSSPSSIASIPAGPAVAPQVAWRGGMLHVRLTVARGDARPFTIDPENSWQHDCLFVHSPERVMMNSPADVTVAFDGHVNPIHANGRVVAIRPAPLSGFALKLLDLGEAQRSMIRTWVARAS